MCAPKCRQPCHRFGVNPTSTKTIPWNTLLWLGLGNRDHRLVADQHSQQSLIRPTSSLLHFSTALLHIPPVLRSAALEIKSPRLNHIHLAHKNRDRCPLFPSQSPILADHRRYRASSSASIRKIRESNGAQSMIQVEA